MLFRSEERPDHSFVSKAGKSSRTANALQGAAVRERLAVNALVLGTVVEADDCSRFESVRAFAQFVARGGSTSVANLRQKESELHIATVLGLNLRRPR